MARQPPRGGVAPEAVVLQNISKKFHHMVEARGSEANTARKAKISRQTVRNILRGETWIDLPTLYRIEKTSTSRYGPETTGTRPNRGSCCTAAPRAPNDPDSKPAVDVLLAPTVAQRCSPAVDLERAETTNAPAERATKALVSAALSGWTCCDRSRPCIRLRIRRQRMQTAT